MYQCATPFRSIWQIHPRRLAWHFQMLLYRHENYNEDKSVATHLSSLSNIGKGMLEINGLMILYKA